MEYVKRAYLGLLDETPYILSMKPVLGRVQG